MKDTRCGTVQFLYEHYIGNDLEMIEYHKEIRDKLEIGIKINNLRIKAGLTEWQLAEMVDTTADVIEDIIFADYDCDYSELVNRIINTLEHIIDASVSIPNWPESRRFART